MIAQLIRIMLSVVFLVTAQSVLKGDTGSEPPQSSRFGRPTSQATPGYRRIEKIRGEPIEARLRPDDKEVILLDLSWGDLSSVPEGQSVLSIMIGASDFVAVGRVNRMEGRLTKQRDDVESDVTIAVSEVVKGNSTKTQTFIFPDGEVRIGPTRVRVERAGAFPLVTGDTVLVFAWNQDGELRTNHRSTFRIANGQVTPLMQGHPLSDTGEAETVLARVREAAASLRKS